MVLPDLDRRSFGDSGAGVWRGSRLVAALILALGLGLGIAATARADAFTVQDVALDASADSAVTARAKALTEGQNEAWRRLVERLTVAGDQGQLAGPGEAELADLIQGFELANERVAPTRYRATLSVSFRPDAVRARLRGTGVRFAEAVSRPLVVIPLLRQGVFVLLWQDENVWRTVWGKRPPESSLVPLIMPLGDVEDINGLSAEQAAAGDLPALEMLASRYNTRGVVVAEVTPTPAGADGRLQLDLVIRRIGGIAEQTVIDHVTGAPGEPLEIVLEKAAQAVAERLNDSWKLANLQHFDERNSLRAVVPLAGLKEWLEVRSRLAEVSAIAGVELAALSRLGAEVVVHYFGDLTQLGTQLEQVELSLVGQEGAYTLVLQHRPGTPQTVGQREAQ
jgi:hypothetical protein